MGIVNENTYPYIHERAIKNNEEDDKKGEGK